jgi:fluoride exporter
LQQILLVALAGALGTLSRYGLCTLSQRLSFSGFPYMTLIINFTGSLLIGFIMQIGLNTDIIPPSLRVIMTIGFLGAFTTFSTFSYETVALLQNSAWGPGLMNIAANVGLGLFATVLGMLAGRLVPVVLKI